MKRVITVFFLIFPLALFSCKKVPNISGWTDSPETLLSLETNLPTETTYSIDENTAEEIDYTTEEPDNTIPETAFPTHLETEPEPQIETTDLQTPEKNNRLIENVDYYIRTATFDFNVTDNVIDKNPDSTVFYSQIDFNSFLE